MTSPESFDPPESLEPVEAGGSPPPASPDVVLLKGHLHPAVLLLRLIDGLRNAALWLVLGVVIDPRLLILAGGLFLFHLGHGLARYLTFQYRLTAKELVTREGILSRQERRIPIDRVQDLGFESTILRRLLGLAVVRVETASGRGAEAVLDSLGRAEAGDLREVLLRARSGRLQAGGADAVADAPVRAEPEWQLFRAGSGILLLRGLSDLRLGAIVVAGFAALELADQLGFLLSLQGVANSFFDWLQGFPLVFAVGMMLLLIGAVLGVGVLASAIGNLMVFHGFTLTLREDSLLCRYGLFTTRQKTLPRARIQRFRIEQTWLRRLLGVAVARADSAGTAHGTGQEAPGGFDVVVPLANLGHINALLPAVLTDLGAVPSHWERASRRLVRRVFLQGVVAVSILFPILWMFLGGWAWLALVLLPAAWLVGRLAWANLAWALGPSHLFLRWGILGRYQAYVPTGKVQALAIDQDPLQRLLGLADLSVFVAGGPPTRVPDLAVSEARPLLHQLADRAGLAAVREWDRDGV